MLKLSPAPALEGNKITTLIPPGENAPAWSSACLALMACKDKSAFNIADATRRQKINQHLTAYYFADSSRLLINTTRSEGASVDTAGQTLRRASLNINARGL